MNKAFEKILIKLSALYSNHNQYDSYYENGMYRATEFENSTRNATVERAREIVREVAEEYNDGWIPCSDRLPKVNEKVLTTHENGMVQFAVFTENKNFVIKDSDGDLYIIPVIAWQPLPEPYKESD